ncbi:MAG: hypothetical protein ACM32O_10495 [Clostridia bacterium]
MKRPISPTQEVNLLAKLADLQETDYQNMVLLHSLIEILIEKGVLTKEDLLAKARHIDTQLHHQIHQTNPLAATPPTIPPFS